MIPAIIGGAMSIAGGLFGASAAKKRAAAAAKERRRLTNKLNNLENNPGFFSCFSVFYHHPFPKTP